MSKPNKVNKSNYDQAGRLTPDELAREYKKQTDVSPPGRASDRVTSTSEARGGGQGDNRSRTEREESE
jgi:hypothetical protein